MKLSQIFEKKPERWGCRGDPYFWEYLQKQAEEEKARLASAKLAKTTPPIDPAVLIIFHPAPAGVSYRVQGP